MVALHMTDDACLLCLVAPRSLSWWARKSVDPRWCRGRINGSCPATAYRQLLETWVLGSVKLELLSVAPSIRSPHTQQLSTQI